MSRSIRQAWTSLLNITGEYQDRNQLCAVITDYLIDYFERFSNKGLADFMEQWQSQDHLVNSSISISAQNKKYSGTCVGINELGHLLLLTKEKKVLSFSSGDATLLK